MAQKLYIDRQFMKLEEQIGYKFKNKELLVQAFTHSSNKNANFAPLDNERLEFLGDAILKYLIAQHLFESESAKNVGDLSLLLSEICSNKMFAGLAAKHQLNEYLVSNSNQLTTQIDVYLAAHGRRDPADILSRPKYKTEDKICEELEENEPKVMADIFEALAGAIYVDSKKQVDKVWKVYYSLMKDQIEHCIEDPFKSPISKLQEKFPGKVTFTSLNETTPFQCRVSVEKQTFIGMGKSKDAAKRAAASFALCST